MGIEELPSGPRGAEGYWQDRRGLAREAVRVQAVSRTDLVALREACKQSHTPRSFQTFIQQSGLYPG